MYREGKLLSDGLPMNFVLNHGALGDVITSLPAVIAGRRADPFCLMRVWGPSWQEDLLRHLLIPYGAFEIRHFEDFPKKKAEREGWGGGHTALNQTPFNTQTRNRVHMVDYAFGCLLDSKPESMAERNYPTEAPLGPRQYDKPYVVLGGRAGLAPSFGGHEDQPHQSGGRGRADADHDHRRSGQIAGHDPVAVRGRQRENDPAGTARSMRTRRGGGGG